MTDQLDYQQECALIRYPFKDNAILSWSNGGNTGILPNNIVLDAVLTIGLANTIHQPFLANITWNGVSWTFNFTYPAISIPVTFTSSISTFSGRTGDNTTLLRIDIDTTQLLCYFTGLGLTGIFHFDNSCILCVSCIRFIAPKVTTLQLANNTPGSGVVTVSTITEGGVNCSEGANMNFDFENETNTFSVVNGGGTGLYDGCTTNLLGQFTTINNTKPNSNQNFFLANDDSFNLISGVNSIYINNNATSECGAADINNFAYYLNRVTNLANELNSYLGTVYGAYESLLTTYTTPSTAVYATYLDSIISTQTNAVNVYANITTGIYNPSGGAISVGLVASYNSAYSIVPGTVYLLTDNTRMNLPNPSYSGGSSALISSQSIPPSQTLYVGLIMKCAASVSNTGSTTNDITFALANSAGTALSNYILAVAPVYFNFNVSHVIVVGSTLKTVTIIVYLVDGSNPTSSSTSITVTGLTGFTVVSSTLVKDGTPTSFGTSAGFSGQTVNYTKTNSYTLVLTCPVSTTGSMSIGLAGTGTSGSTSKTLNFTL